MLLHGGGQTRRAWDRAARELAVRGFTAVTLDQRGHGESAWVDCGSYAIWDYAADAIAVAGELAGQHGQAPAAVGASLGGIAALLAEGEAEPGLWSSLVLVDITPAMDPAGVNRIQSFMGAAMADGFATIEEAAEAVAAYLPHRPKPRSLDGLRKNLRQDSDGRYRWHWDPRFLDGPRTVNTHWQRGEEDLHTAAAELAIPTLLVRGGASELVSPAHVAAFRELVPHAQYVDVTGAGHMVAGDRNDVFSDAIVGFLSESPSIGKL